MLDYLLQSSTDTCMHPNMLAALVSYSSRIIAGMQMIMNLKPDLVRTCVHVRVFVSHVFVFLQLARSAARLGDAQRGAGACP